MLNFLLIIFFCIMAFHIAKTARRETPIFREFNQSGALVFLVLLYPLGPVIYITTVYRLGWLVALLATVACYLPALFVARKHLSVFERAGTDRVKGAQSASSQAYGTAIIGLIYAGILLAFALINGTSGEFG